MKQCYIINLISSFYESNDKYSLKYVARFWYIFLYIIKIICSKWDSVWHLVSLNEFELSRASGSFLDLPSIANGQRPTHSRMESSLPNRMLEMWWKRIACPTITHHTCRKRVSVRSSSPFSCYCMAWPHLRPHLSDSVDIELTTVVTVILLADLNEPLCCFWIPKPYDSF